MEDVLGLVLLAFYIVGIVGLAALITWVVIKIFPTERTPKSSHPSDTSSGTASGSGGAGSLFRRSKSGTN